MADEDDDRRAPGIVISQNMLITGAIGLAMILISGSFFMGHFTTSADYTSTGLSSYKLEVDQRFAAIDKRLDGDEGKMSTGNTATNQIDLRLTRMEAQLSFLVNTAAPLATKNPQGGNKE